MISGIDVIMYQPDEESKKLAKLAIPLGLDGTVVYSPKWTTVEAALKSLPKGQKWLDSFNKARDLGSTSRPAPVGSTMTAVGMTRWMCRFPA